MARWSSSRRRSANRVVAARSEREGGTEGTPSAHAGGDSPRTRPGGRAPRWRDSGHRGPGRRRQTAPGERAHARTRGAGLRSSGFLCLRERVAKLGPRPMQSRLYCWDGEVEALTDLLEREVGVVVQQDRQSVRGIELRERLEERGIVCPARCVVRRLVSVPGLGGQRNTLAAVVYRRGWRGPSETKRQKAGPGLKGPGSEKACEEFP